MRLKRLKYERKSTLKSCYVNLSSTWSEVKSKIASAFDLNITTLLEEASLIVADSELVEEGLCLHCRSIYTIAKVD